MTDSAAEAFLRRVLTYSTANLPDRETVAVNERAIKVVGQLYVGRGKGADLPSASGTAWGLLNSISEYVDHHRRARSDDHRLDAAWFGAGATLKQRAWDEAMKLVAWPIRSRHGQSTCEFRFRAEQGYGSATVTPRSCKSNLRVRLSTSETASS